MRAVDANETRDGLERFVGLIVETEFFEPREARLTPVNSQLARMDLEPAEHLEPPEAMTGNDAFRIIEIIKEREALLALRRD